VKVGVVVYCLECHRMKQPRGRSAPMGPIYCDSDCDGYEQDPQVGSLWPNETEEDFGYPVGDIGTEKINDPLG